MPNTALGQRHLRSDLDKVVPKGRTIGVYALGYVDPSDDAFVVRYVGRSDSNDNGLNGRLHDHDGTKTDCTHFKFTVLASEREAYERESRIYHDFDPGLNEVHPALPNGVSYGCPVTSCQYALKPKKTYP